jgi:hypothetical protein
MSTGIADARHNPIGTHIVWQYAQILVYEAYVKEALSVGLELQTQPGLYRVLSSGFGEMS